MARSPTMKVVHIQVSTEELKLWRHAAADAEARSLSDYIRQAVREYAGGKIVTSKESK